MVVVTLCLHLTEHAFVWGGRPYLGSNHQAVPMLEGQSPFNTPPSCLAEAGAPHACQEEVAMTAQNSRAAVSDAIYCTSCS